MIGTPFCIRGWLGLLAFACMSVILPLTPACFTDRPSTCDENSDCAASGGICSVAGFCEHECSFVTDPTSDGSQSNGDGGVDHSASPDCPVNSFCAADCRVCIRDDNSSPATCFGSDHGLDQAQILGACGRAIGAHAARVVDGPGLVCTDSGASATTTVDGSSTDAATEAHE